MKIRYIDLFNPILKEIVEMRYLIKDPIILEDTRLESLLGGLNRTSYDEGIRQCVTFEQGRKS